MTAEIPPLCIGIVIPAYNAAGTLHKTLQSVATLKQSVTRLRYYCVVVDDASTDATQTIVQTYVTQGVVDQSLKHARNLGVSAARNLGIEACQHTDFITFCDADDELLIPDSGQAEWILRYRDCDLMVFDHLVSEGREQKIIAHQAHLQPNAVISDHDMTTYLEKYLQQPNRYHVWTTCWSKLFSTRFVHAHHLSFNAQMKVFEDVKFNFECLQFARQCVYLAFPLYVHYRPETAQLNTSATMGGYCSVTESFAFDEALAMLPAVFAKTGHPLRQAQISHCLGAYAVITIIRASLKIKTLASFFSVRKQLAQVLSQSHFRQAFRSYDPKLAGGNPSIPRLIRQGWLTMAIIMARRLAVKRYAAKPQKG